LSPPSEPRQSTDEQARNHNHHAGDEYGQAGKQQKVTREKTHSRASPLPPCAASILTLRAIALRLLPDSGAITKYFTQHASPPRRDHSITSSARASSCGGTSRPSALAVFRLITSSNLVGCCTGRSAGFAPLRIRPA